MQKSPVRMQFANQPAQTWWKNPVLTGGWFEPAGWFSEHWVNVGVLYLGEKVF